jgi:acetyl-CoA C-acetyltransferase
VQPREDRIAVIVGVGEWIDRPASADQGMEPLRMMEAAARAAEQDAGAALLALLDSIDVVCELSWPYPAAPARLAALLGAQPARAVYGPIGGESPIRFIHEAALRIASGESQAALVVGAEAEYTVGMARKQGVTLDWETRDDTPLVRGKDFLHPQAVLHGMALAPMVYPLFENAATASWGQTPRQAQQASAALWEKYSAVAAANPFSWLHEPLSAAEIGTPGPGNRMIAWPYVKHMVANPMVNQGAAVIITSLALARAAGVAEDKMVYVYCGAAASEPRDYLDRAQLDRSHALEAVLEKIVCDVGGDAHVFSAAELYSCFPIVPKIALRILGTPDLAPTVAGGLSFFGAPFNNYMTHGAAAMVRHLRGQDAALGLLYGNGGFMTYHHALVLCSDLSRANGKLAQHYRVQQEADARQPQAPRVADNHAGVIVIESFTVVHGRDGAPLHGTVIGRSANDERVLARVSAEDSAGIARLMDAERTPVGLKGSVTMGGNGMLIWRF